MYCSTSEIVTSGHQSCQLGKRCARKTYAVASANVESNTIAAPISQPPKCRPTGPFANRVSPSVTTAPRQIQTCGPKRFQMVSIPDFGRCVRRQRQRRPRQGWGFGFEFTFQPCLRTWTMGLAPPPRGRAVEPQVDRAAVQRHVQGVIATIAPHDSVARFEGLGARVIRAEARFIEPKVLIAGEHRIKAHRVIIGAGDAKDRAARERRLLHQRNALRQPDLARASAHHRRRPDRHRDGTGAPPARLARHRRRDRHRARSCRMRRPITPRCRG